ncbi:DinB family protein [Brevibacillus sp. TJ4]|uniref:DinB family protein n=1 Tax=Brevibacillus sp. TJ4 TaxID=3234853 RepID=UPI003BA360F0
MITSVEQFVTEWTQESEQTVRLLSSLTDESLLRRIAPGHWTLGEIAWHLVGSLHYMTYLGLSFPAPRAEQPMTAAEILEAYRMISRDMLAAVQTQWGDDSLQEEREMAGERWKNGASLRFVLMHQAHHRGQMTVLMRQAGIADIPRMYG